MEKEVQVLRVPSFKIEFSAPIRLEAELNVTCAKVRLVVCCLLKLCMFTVRCSRPLDDGMFFGRKWHEIWRGSTFSRCFQFIFLSSVSLLVIDLIHEAGGGTRGKGTRPYRARTFMHLLFMYKNILFVSLLIRSFICYTFALNFFNLFVYCLK